MKRNKETIWLKEVDSIALQFSLRNLSDSFSRFFKKQSKKPKFKSKKNNIQSYTTKNVNNNIEVLGNKLKLPKLRLVRFAKSKELKWRILQATIRKNSSGKFFVSLVCEEEILEFPKTNSSIGIDLGIADFAILSDGQKITNKKFVHKIENKLKREQRKLSRHALIAKKKCIDLPYAKNYQKQKRKVARLYEKITNQRNDFLNKLSTEIIKVDRWFPSSQICSKCGHKDGKKPLNVRQWICPVCHTYHDRDINASKNILKEGLRIKALT
ncbi:RNA-guided endonuclease TnpB family protein [Clostridium sp.]|jgi:putative transposase|uniref:RNA-guided endonuclease TnpB family protein n=1 Tax=Clostridium sp. TaxID=1506 RepID=UPI003A5BD1ED